MITTNELVNSGARLIDATTGNTLRGHELHQAIDAAASAWDELPPGVVFLGMGIDMDSIIRYLGAFRSGRAIALLDPALPDETLTEFIQRFTPAVVCGFVTDIDDTDTTSHAVLGTVVVRRTPAPVPHPDLAVLLATSGSTGEAKLVRLSRAAVTANASAIAQALTLTTDDTAPTSLPLFYSYGLSVLNSHLSAGASVLVADGGALSGEFWRACSTFHATSFAGVPYHYQLLKRIRWNAAKYPSITTLTQAGGRLDPVLIKEFAGQVDHMYIMYGQTEATARMAVLPAESLNDKLGSAGIALPGGSFSIIDTNGKETQQPNIDGEILYRGDNVMMGYATKAIDMTHSDDMQGVLNTGDIGHLDTDDFLWITGRAKRIGKIFGIRVNLDDLERIATTATTTPVTVAVIPTGDTVTVYCETSDNTIADTIKTRLCDTTRLHRSGIDVRPIDVFPLLTNGKIDYRSLEKLS